MGRLHKIIKHIAPVISLAFILFAVKSMLEGDGSWMQYAFFGSIGGFFGGDEIEDAINAQQQYVMGPWEDAWEDIFGEGGVQEQTLGDYQSQYREMLDFFEQSTTQAREQLQLRQAEEMGFLDTGKDASLQAIGQQFQELRGQTQTQNIMQGLSNTSWGGQMMGAIGVQQGLAEAGVETDYAQRYAATTARQGMDMSNFDQWRIGGQSSLQGQFAEGLAGLRGNWAGRRLDAEEAGVGFRSSWADRHIELAERNVGVGLDFASSLMGGFGF